MWSSASAVAMLHAETHPTCQLTLDDGNVVDIRLGRQSVEDAWWAAKEYHFEECWCLRNAFERGINFVTRNPKTTTIHLATFPRRSLRHGSAGRAGPGALQTPRIERKIECLNQNISSYLAIGAHVFGSRSPLAVAAGSDPGPTWPRFHSRQRLQRDNQTRSKFYQTQNNHARND